MAFYNFSVLKFVGLVGLARLQFAWQKSDVESKGQFLTLCTDS